MGYPMLLLMIDQTETMNMKLLKTILAALSLSLPLMASAQPTNTPKFDQHQANQAQRIQQGVQSGSLTQQEAARLDRGQDRLQAKEDMAKTDGVVTKKERAQLQHAESRQGQRIYRQKHDRQNDSNHDGRIDRLAHRVR